MHLEQLLNELKQRDRDFALSSTSSGLRTRKNGLRLISWCGDKAACCAITDLSIRLAGRLFLD